MAGLPYTLSEVMAAGAASPLNHYHASVTCTRTTGSTDVSAIASLPFTITPTNGDDIACTITNTQQPRLILNKKVGLRLDSNDQFTVAVVGTPLIAGTNTTATTTGSETEKSTDNLILQHGSSYTLRDWVSSSTVVPANKISNYGRSLTCSNSRSGTGTSLPDSGDLSTNTALSPEAAEAALTVHAGDVISCTFANSARPALSVTKVVGLAANSADRFKISIRNTDGEARVQDDVSSEVSKSLTTDGVSGNTLVVKVIGTSDTAKTFVIEEEMTNATSTEISAYSTTLACTNTNSVSNGGTDVSNLTIDTVGSVRRTTFTLAAYGTDILNTGTALDNISCTLTNTASLPKMTVRTVSQDGVGTFAYQGYIVAGDNYSNGFDALNLTTASAGVAVSSTTQFLDAADTETRIEQVPLAGWVLASASCTDNNAAQTGNPASSGAVGVFLPSVGVAVSKTQMKAGADIVCTFTNQKLGSTVSGLVFQDNGADAGAGAGTAHNGVQDGGEAGVGNIRVRLYNNTDGTCSVLLSEALTNGKGEYSLNVPVSVAANTPLCVQEQNAAGMQSVSFKSDSTAASYTRSTDRATFTWMGVAVQGLNFGDVLTSRLDNSSQQIIKPGSTTEHAHRFVAGTAGSVTFSIQNAVSVPALLGWSEVLYKDEDCSGTLDSAQGDAQLALSPDGSATVGVSAGGVICLIVRQFSPLAAPEDARRSFTLRAVMTHEPVGILGAITETLVQNDTARVSEQALHLLKQVCNFSKTSGCTQQADWLTSNSAQRGDTVQYRITYQNQGTSAISNLIIRDTTPNYTTFVGAECVTPLPSGLTVCSEARAEAGTGPAPGGVGNLMWVFTGTLNPSGKGSVQFKVLVD